MNLAETMPWTVLGRARTPGGGELLLRGRGGDFEIRLDGRELMTSRGHFSEEAMARLACARLAARAAPRLLIGGLGMGYTLRAALDAAPPDAEIVVVELVSEVVEWNRGALAELAGRPLQDARVEVALGDVAARLRTARAAFDAILLDVDNGPGTVTRPGNRVLYGTEGLSLARRALRAGGVLAVWSADPSPEFVARLRRSGFDAESLAVPARGAAGGPEHTIFLASPARRPE